MRIVRRALTSIPYVVGTLFAAGIAVLLLGHTERTVIAQGEVRIREYHSVRPEFSGLVSEVYVAPGDPVQPGQALLRLHDPGAEQSRLEIEHTLHGTTTRLASLQLQLRHLQGLVHPLLRARDQGAIQQGALQAEVRRLRVSELAIQLQAAEEREARAQELADAGLLSIQDLRGAFFERREIEQRHRSSVAEAELEEQRHAALQDERQLAQEERQLAILQLEQEIREVDIQRDRWRKTLDELAAVRAKQMLLAPGAGTVVGTPTRELLGRSAVAGEELLMVVDIDSVYFMTWVSEQAIVRVRLGQAAQIDIVGLPHQRFKMFSGQVTKVARNPMAIQGSGPRRYAVEIRLHEPSVELDDGHFILRTGMRGTAKIAFQQRVPLLRAVYDFLLAT